MTTRYVGSGGSDSNSGLSWALRKLTLNGVEDTPVVAGDTVYVGPGTYRELLTVDVSGTNGNPITYIGDYTGANTDGVGGVVRITGSNDDLTATRANCITATTKNYRTFTGFAFDLTSGTLVSNAGGSDWTVQKCHFSGPVAGRAINITGAGQANCIIQNCFFFSRITAGITISHSATLDNIGHVIQNCIMISVQSNSIEIQRVGGITVKNCFIASGGAGVTVQAGGSLAVGQTETVNNNIFQFCGTALSATATGEITENYNAFFGNGTDRTNTSTGANSNTYPALMESRWFFQLVNAGAGPNSTTQVVTPFDLSSFSQLINVAGTSPTSTDLRGTSAISSVREWGALEYDSTLKIAGGGGAVSILPRIGF